MNAGSRYEDPGIRRICDLVMKGGVTSGIVYPPTICKLATQFVIKNIGGTSVGAIAAALTAAAEYRRRTTGSGAGYDGLARLPEFLKQPGALLALFAADKRARALLSIALTAVGPTTFLAKLARFLTAMLLQYAWAPILTFIVIFGVCVGVASPLREGVIWRCVAATFIFGFIASVTIAAACMAWHALSLLSRNSYGLCHGFERKGDSKFDDVDVTTLPPDQVPPLTNWLDAFIARTAGKPRATPLTFGDLWQAPEPPWHSPAAGEAAIDFCMITTCLTLGRPFRLPFAESELFGRYPDPQTDMDAQGKKRPTIYFRPSDFKKYFPTAVVEHMTAAGRLCALVPGDYYRFPAPDKVPVIVATRMSMSFPVLFCAVPLYALDARGVMQKLWFSDGGLTSNFPVHFFDSPLPRWPTFAIDLLASEPGTSKNQPGHAAHWFAGDPLLQKYAPQSVFIEGDLKPGTVNPWNRIDRGSALAKMLGFASAILDAARNWQDATLVTLPGNASRTAGIRLPDAEGGLNLNMTPQQIADLLSLGNAAGEVLAERFLQSGPDPAGWQKHRWTRYTATMGAITRWLDGYDTGYKPFVDMPQQLSYERMLQQNAPPSSLESMLNVTQLLSVTRVESGFYEIEPVPIAVLPTRPVV